MISGLKLGGKLAVAAGFPVAVITALVLTAAVGDALYIKLMPVVAVESVPAALGKAIVCAKLTHTTMKSPAQMEAYRVIRKSDSLIFADGKERINESAAKRFERALKGQRAGGASDDFDADLVWTQIKFDAETCWEEYIDLLHGSPVGKFKSISLTKGEDDKLYSTITLIVTAPTETYFDDVDAGTAIKALDVVE